MFGFSYEETLPVDGSELMLALESLVIATGVDDGPTNIKPLRIALRCLVSMTCCLPWFYKKNVGCKTFYFISDTGFPCLSLLM